MPTPKTAVGSGSACLQLIRNKNLSALGEEGYTITTALGRITIASCGEAGLFYGAFHLLRLQETGADVAHLNISERPAYDIRILNHWDNLDHTIERGYAGRSLWQWDQLPATLSPRYEAYARANASIGINATVLNNVNASPEILSPAYLAKPIPKACPARRTLDAPMPTPPPARCLGLPRIVTCAEDIDWFLHAVDNPHNGLTFCAGSLSAGLQNDVPALARRFASRIHFVHLRSTNISPDGNFIEASHLEGRGCIPELVRIFEKERPCVPMRVDHGRLMLDDADKGYNPGYSFHGRMLALAQVEGMMAMV